MSGLSLNTRFLDSPAVRFVVGVPLSALVTISLFHGMRLLISADYQQPDDIRQHTLEAITPERQEQTLNRRARAKPRRLDSAKKPPPPPKLTAKKQDIDLPAVNIQGAPPAEIPMGDLGLINFNPANTIDRNAQPIRPPVVTFPRTAMERGIPGTCDVQFHVDTRGKPYNLRTTCSSSIFKREAEKAISQAEFAPKVQRGKAMELRDVLYTIEFKLEEKKR